MIPVSTKKPHEENSLRLGAGVRLSNCDTVKPRVPGDMITGVKQYEGHAVDACVKCSLQGREPSAGVERQIDMMGSLVQGRRKERFWGRKMGEGATAADIGRREIGYRPVDFDREGKRIEGGKGARSAPSRSGTTGGGYEGNTGSPGVPCTEDLWEPVVGSHRAVVHERTGRVAKDRALGRGDDRIGEMPATINDREGVPPRGGNTTGGKNFSDVGGPREEVVGGEVPSLTRKEGDRCVGRERESVECALKHLGPVDFSPGPAVTHSIPLYEITKRVEVKGMQTLQVRGGPGMPGDRGAHQRLMERGTRSLDREGELFGDASVPFPAKFDQAGDPVAGADNLRSDGGKGEVVGKTMTPSHKSISCPSRPMVS